MLKRLMQVFAAPADRDAENPVDKVSLAAAVLLLEVAYADGEFHTAERELIGSLLKQQFHIEKEFQAELLDLAEQARENSSDLHQFTREINQGFSQPEKERIIEAIWRLVYADGRLDRYEEALMRQLGSLIGLSHRQLIDAKLRVTNT
jgi:uncharacterized tellurite resistance protein B-like protein